MSPRVPAMGAQLIEPMREANGDVDPGRPRLGSAVPAGPLDQPTGEVTVSGYVRFGDTAALVQRR